MNSIASDSDRDEFMICSIVGVGPPPPAHGSITTIGAESEVVESFERVLEIMDAASFAGEVGCRSGRRWDHSAVRIDWHREISQDGVLN